MTGDSGRPFSAAYLDVLRKNPIASEMATSWSGACWLWAGGGELPDPIDGAVAHLRHRTQHSGHPWSGIALPPIRRFR
jgi:hypothetical protein